MPRRLKEQPHFDELLAGPYLVPPQACSELRAKFFKTSDGATYLVSIPALGGAMARPSFDSPSILPSNKLSVLRSKNVFLDIWTLVNVA